MQSTTLKEMQCLREIPVPPMFESAVCYPGDEQFVASSGPRVSTVFASLIDREAVFAVALPGTY